MLNMIDVSNWQAGLQLAAVPHDAVIVKATEGQTTDKAFADFMAQSAGSLRGCYHFAHPELSDARAEADWFLSVAHPHLDGQTVMVLDWEPGNAQNSNTAWALAWCQRVRELTGVIPVVYLSFDVFDRYDWSALVKEGCWFWVAAYPDMNAQGYGNRWPVSIDAPMFAQQYSAAGSLPGYGGALDLNECYLDADGWRALARGDLAAIPAPSFNLAAFEEAVIGKPIDPDGQYGPQCVDLADYYAASVFGVPWMEAIGGVKGARDLADVAPTTGRWRFDPNTPTYVPPAGALAILDRTEANGWWGHVQLVTSATMNAYSGLEQNAPKPYVTTFKRDYSGVVGFLVPLIAGAAHAGGNAVQAAPPAQQPTPETAPAPAPAGGFQWWVVDPGDTLSGIAAANGTTVDHLLALNPQITDPNTIFVGQRIELTGDAQQAAPAQSSGFQWWDVDPGDTLSGIAAANGTTVERLLELNPQITNPDAIFVGQRINLV